MRYQYNYLIVYLSIKLIFICIFLSLVELVYGWVDDEELDQMFAEKDQKIIEQLSELLAKTKQRERGVNYVADRIFKEVEGLDTYLNIMVGNTVRIQNESASNE